jgi:hypothetical protein
MSKLNDIEKHNWYDSNIFTAYPANGLLSIRDTEGIIEYSTEDASAIANHFNLFDNYVSVDKIKALIEKYDNLDTNTNNWECVDAMDLVSDLEHLIKPKDKLNND